MGEVDAVIEVEGLRKVFRGFKSLKVGPLPIPWGQRLRVEAVAGIDLTVRRGEIYGFLGPNGAGKTTTIKMLMGLIRPSAGVMRIFGGAPDEIETRARIGYLPEQPYFYDYLRPREILDFFGKLFLMPRAAREARIDELLPLVGLEDSQNKKLREFSKGMLQRIGIAGALLNEPDLVVLDEPLSGLDPIGRKELRDIIVAQRDLGRTVFFSSHILSDIEMICDKVAIIDHGVIRAVGTLAELLDSEHLEVEIIVRGVSQEILRDRFASVARVERIGEYSRLIVGEGQSNDALRVILELGGHVEGVVRRRESLEDLFVRSAERRGPAVGEEGA